MDSPVPRGVCGTATPTPRSSPGNEAWRRQSSHWSCQHGIAASPSGSLRPPLPNLLGMYLAKPGDAQRDVSPCSRANSRGRREGDYLRGDGDSIMGEVQDRIREMEARMVLDVESDTHEVAVMAHVRTNRTNPSGVTGIAASGWTEDSQGEEKKPRPKRCRIPFRPAIIMTVAFGALLTCVLMFLPLYEFTTQLQTKTAESFGKSVNRQFGLIEELTSRAATASHRSILGRIRNLLWETVMEPPDRAIDALWGTMQMSHSFDPAWTGQTEKQRAAMAYRAFLELQQQQKEANHTHRQTGAADFLYVAFQGGDFSGTSFRLRNEDTQKGYKAKWFDCPLHSSTAEDTFLELGVVKKDPECNEKFPLKRPWYTLQSNMAEIGGPLKRLWSGLYVYLDGTTIGLTKTAPVAYCGDYSCFEGVIAADITLKVVGQSCDEAFVTLQQELMASAYQFPINRSNAVVFVVSQLTRGQQAPGVLVGASHLQLDQIVMAQHSSEALVSSTSMELLRRFGEWNASALQEEQLFRFRAANGSTDCGVEFSQFTDPECLQVGTLSVQLDEVDRWLVVIVSPAVAFFTLAKHIEENVMEELEAIDTNMDMMGVTILQSAALAFFVTTALTVGIGFGLGTAVSSPLRELTFLLRRLGHLDFGRFGVCLQAKAGRSIRDICEVQDAFCRLSMGIQTFARFVPEAVVRNIIKGDCRAARLHVTKREVTIMFSDIKDFTAMSETMKQTDLIFLLTRYLSIMSRIVETFGGVVAEILGDGLLVYWNTPLDVEDHAVKACAAAVAMQQALGPLNYEITECKLEPLKVRIGVNTGEVLSGTFGSDLKMKFGCMGDPVNLASRLEGLCKVYDAGIIVSGTTYDSIANSGFICRKLDLVQVKGRKEPVMVYEVMGCDLTCDPCPFLHEMTADDSQSSSPRKGDSMVSKTFSRDSKESRRSNASRVSEVFFTKSPSQAALEALEESRQGLNNLSGFNWKVPEEKRSDRSAKHRPAPSNPTSPLPRSTSRSVNKAGSIVTPDVDKLMDLARRYEAALEVFQGARFQEAYDLAEVLLHDFPEDEPTHRLSQIAWQKIHNQADADVEEPFSVVTVMNEKH